MPMQQYTLKICGIRRPQDIEEINKYLEIGYIGFVFYKKSKRYVTKEQALELRGLLRQGLKAVGVFAECSLGEVKEIADFVGLDVLQLHSDEDMDFCQSLKNDGYTVWRAVRVKDKDSLDKVEDYPVDGFVLDAYTPKYGGEGKVFDWSLVGDFAKNHFTMAAGGINAANIRAALEAIKPNGIDLSSAVETDGFKDKEKIKQLINTLREE